MNYADVARYLCTDKGTVHVAALVIKKGKSLFHNDLEGYSPAKKEAVYVTYYKQGDSYWQRYQSAKAANPAKTLEPGEGCRVLLQRDRFLKELHGSAKP